MHIVLNNFFTQLGTGSILPKKNFQGQN